MRARLLIIALLICLPVICEGDYELRLIDGGKLRWHEYSVEGDQYCTRNNMGKVCIQKSDVLSLNETGRKSIDSEAQKPVILTPTGQAPMKTVDGVPVTGVDTRGAALMDEAMLDAMRRIGCSAATLAVSDHGKVMYLRGYGWMDEAKKVPTEPDTMIGIASCEKPLTAAAVKQLARDGYLNLDAGIFSLLKVKPRGPVKDPRVHKITLRHILEHKAGWGADPVSAAAAALRKDGVADPIPVELMLSMIMTQPLKNDPGTVGEYCNFGYDTLRHVLERASGRRPDDYFNNVLFRPDAVNGFYGAGSPLPQGSPPVVWNADRGGPISASAPALLAFMRHYWLTGEPRDSGNPLWVMYGSLDGSTSVMVWRSDGIDLVALFNGRGNFSHDEVSRRLQAVIERLR